MKRLLVPIALAVLASCSSEIDELKTFVRDSEKGLPRRIEPLPPVKPFEPFAYEGFDLPDPFKPRKLSPPKEGSGGGLAPDLNRRKEPLEAYPLDSMSMVGSVQKQGQPYALLRVDNLLYQVKVGDYLGQNYGRITRISETEITLRELAPDAAGEMIERPAALQLQERAR